MKKLLVIFLVASLAVGCKGKKAAGWPQKDRTDFTKDCEKDATASMGEEKGKSYCSCMMAKLEVKYSTMADAGKIDLNTMTEMAKDCAK